MNTFAIQLAVKLLTEYGYEVKAPSQPLNGKVVIYCWDSEITKIQTVTKEIWDKNFGYTSERKELKLIAIVDWTEGQGI